MITPINQGTYIHKHYQPYAFRCCKKIFTNTHHQLKDGMLKEMRGKTLSYKVQYN